MSNESNLPRESPTSSTNNAAYSTLHFQSQMSHSAAVMTPELEMLPGEVRPVEEIDLKKAGADLDHGRLDSINVSTLTERRGEGREGRMFFPVKKIYIGPTNINTQSYFLPLPFLL